MTLVPHPPRARRAHMGPIIYLSETPDSTRRIGPSEKYPHQLSSPKWIQTWTQTEFGGIEWPPSQEIAVKYNTRIYFATFSPQANQPLA